jgi:uncharacterized Ntn-hydrolase superfamily protein
MRGGKSAPDALRALIAGDGDEAIRQVGMVDASGRVATHTGARCVEACGHASEDGVTVQANMMERDTVWSAMLAAFAKAEGPLAERLLAALWAAEGEGGDMRGRQSAALLVVGGDRASPRWGRLVDLRVDAHPDPLVELERLLRLHRAYEHLERGSGLAERGDLQAAAAEHSAARALAPEDDQVTFWTGLTTVGAGRPVEGRALLEEARAANPRWAGYLRRFADGRRLPDDPAFLDALFPLEP